MSRRFDDEITFYPDGTAVPYGMDPEPEPVPVAVPVSVPVPRRPDQVPTAIGELKTQHGYQCGFHPHISVSEHTPVVTCTVCGERLDPYDVLRQFMRSERQFAYRLEGLRDEASRLTVDVTSLRKERANLRSQIRRATRGKQSDDGEMRLRDTAEVRRIREQIRRTTGGAGK